MSLLQSKKDIEQYFNTNYSTTPIHWAGMNFDTSAQDEWVYIEYAPSFIATGDISNGRYKQEGKIQFTTVANTPFRATELADIVISLFQSMKIGSLFMSRVSIVNQSYVEDIDKSVVEFDIELTTF